MSGTFSVRKGPDTFSPRSGSIGAGFGSTIYGGVFSGACAINWEGFVQGAAIGAVAGFVGGYVGAIAPAWTGTTMLGCMNAAAIGAAYMDITWQAGASLTGLQTGYDAVQTLTNMAIAWGTTGVLLVAAQGMSRPTQTQLPPAEWQNPITAEPGTIQRGVPATALRPGRADLEASRLDSLRQLASFEGVAEPLVVGRNGVIIRGNHRVRVAAERGGTVDVIVTSFEMPPAANSIFDLLVR